MLTKINVFIIYQGRGNYYNFVLRESYLATIAMNIKKRGLRIK